VGAEKRADERAADTCSAFCFNEGLVTQLREVLPAEQELRWAESFFAALGNRTRLLVLFCLAQADELCVCDIANCLQMNLSTVSHQLRYLRGLGLVDYRREGKMAFYRLTKPRIGKLLTEEFQRATEAS
jgi:DNA-binding transcriptional ArsR family regulator